MMQMKSWRISSYLALKTKRSKIIYWERSLKVTIVSKHYMRPEWLSLNWLRGKCWVLWIPVWSESMLLGKNSQEGKQNCPAYEKNCDKCGGKNHFKAMCRSSEGSKDKSRKGSDRTSGRKCTHRCNVHEISEDCHDDNGMDDLADQVQSLFYH